MNGTKAAVVGVIAVVAGLFLWDKYGSKKSAAGLPTLEVAPERAMPMLWSVTNNQYRLSDIPESDLSNPFPLGNVPVSSQQISDTLSSFMTMPSAIPSLWSGGAALPGFGGKVFDPIAE